MHDYVLVMQKQNAHNTAPQRAGRQEFKNVKILIGCCVPPILHLSKNRSPPISGIRGEMHEWQVGVSTYSIDYDTIL